MLISRTAATVTTPFGGGLAWNISSSSGGSANTSASSSGGGGTQTVHKGCKWSDFGAAILNIKSIKMKYDWSWTTHAQGSVDTDGFCSATGSAGGGAFSGGSGVSLSGPGPVSNSDDDTLSGSANTTLPNNTVLSTLSTDATSDSTAESGISGSTGAASCTSSVQVSSLVVEVTTFDAVGPFSIM